MKSCLTPWLLKHLLTAWGAAALFMQPSKKTRPFTNFALAACIRAPGKLFHTNVVFLFIGVRSEKRWFSCLFGRIVVIKHAYSVRLFTLLHKSSLTILNSHYFRPQKRSQKQEAEKGNQTSNQKAAKVICLFFQCNVNTLVFRSF